MEQISTGWTPEWEERRQVRMAAGGSSEEPMDEYLAHAQRPAPAAKQPPAPVDDVVAREGCYTKEQIEKVLRGVFVSGRFDELTWTNETVDELMPMVLARLVARDECWRGALAAKDQTIALLREHLALAKGGQNGK